MTRILIADDHDVVREGLRRLLEAQPNCEVVAEASDGKDAILKAFETKPDIALVDYSLPLINGMEVTRQIRARLPKTEVLVFTMHTKDPLAIDQQEVIFSAHRDAMEGIASGKYDAGEKTLGRVIVGPLDLSLHIDT